MANYSNLSLSILQVKDLKKLHSKGSILLQILSDQMKLCEIRMREEEKAIDAILPRMEFEERFDHQLLGMLYSDMERRKKIVYKIQIWSKSLDDWAYLNLPKPKIILQLKLPGSTSELSVFDFVNEIASKTQQKLNLISSLLAISASVTSPDKKNRESEGGWAHLRDLDIFDGEMLDAYLTRMGKRSTPTQRENAIGASKELLEALARGMLEGDFTDDELKKFDFAVLFKKVRKILSIDENLPKSLGKENQGVDQIMGGLTSVLAGITNLRNEVGTGHGRPRVIQGLSENHVMLVVDATYTLSRFYATLIRESQ